MKCILHKYVDDEIWHNAMPLFKAKWIHVDNHLLGTVGLASLSSLGTTEGEVLSAMHKIMKQLCTCITM